MDRAHQPAATRPQRRRSRISSILDEDLARLPDYVRELDGLLSGPAVDLKKLTRLIRGNHGLSTRILALANSPLFNLSRRTLTIPEAIVLLGSVRSRTLVLSCAVMEITDGLLPAEVAQNFWQHGFLAAMFSERIARWLGHAETEEAYVAGLFHDVGELPLLIAAGEQADGAAAAIGGWKENGALERELFLVDHCEAGRWMGISWDFPPALIDVCEHHHQPGKARQNPCLVGIVAAGDFFCRQAFLPCAEFSSRSLDLPETSEEFIEECLPRLRRAERQALVQFLDGENLNSLPFPELAWYEEQIS